MKKVITIAFSLALFLFPFFSVSHATSSIPEITPTQNNTLTIDQLNDVAANNTDVEIVDKQELPIGTPTMQFATPEELQVFIDSLNNNDSKPTVTDEMDTSPIFDDPLEIQSLSSARTYYGAKVVSWYSPYGGSIFFNSAFVWKHIDFEYSYHYSGGHKVFNSISSIQSYISGMYTADWHQASKSNNYYESNRGVHFQINGYYLVGVQVGGSSVGIRNTDSWTKSYHF